MVFRQLLSPLAFNEVDVADRQNADSNFLASEGITGLFRL